MSLFTNSVADLISRGAQGDFGAANDLYKPRTTTGNSPGPLAREMSQADVSQAAKNDGLGAIGLELLRGGLDIGLAFATREISDERADRLERGEVQNQQGSGFSVAGLANAGGYTLIVGGVLAAIALAVLIFKR